MYNIASLNIKKIPLFIVQTSNEISESSLAWGSEMEAPTRWKLAWDTWIKEI
jgi:hypothetical protein